jgi:hypothetical protein
MRNSLAFDRDVGKIPEDFKMQRKQAVPSRRGIADSPMEVVMVFGLLMTVLGIGALCGLLYSAAVWALPVGIGIWTGYALMQWGVGPVGAIICGFAAGGMALALGQTVLTSSRSSPLRVAIVIAFVVPAILAGYGTALDLSAMGFASGFWQHVFAILGAAAVGGTTLARLLAPDERETVTT